MNEREDRIRTRAYEIWERQQRTGRPEDHWFEAERELASEQQRSDTLSNRSDAGDDEASAAEAVEASGGAAAVAEKSRRPRRSSRH